MKTPRTSNFRRETNLLYPYEVDNASLIFRCFYYHLILKVNAMYSLLRRKKKKKNKEKPNNPVFMLCPIQLTLSFWKANDLLVPLAAV